MPRSENFHSFGSIGHDLGLLLHVPGAMALTGLIVVIGSGEWSMLPGFLLTVIIGLGIGQLLYRVCQPEGPTTTSQAMIIVALGWLLVVVLGAIPFIVAAHLNDELSDSGLVFRHPLNALFESMSGFTSTGLTMTSNPSTLPASLQWWRTFSEWIGGIGVMVLALALFDPTEEHDSLYSAETRTTQFGDNIQDTAQRIWAIFVGYTLVAIGAFFLAGMPLWESINHGMTGIATGGFTITSNSFRDYNVMIKSVAIMIMILGAINFVTHHAILIRHNASVVLRKSQLRALLLLFISGTILLMVIELSRHMPTSFIDEVFQWTSALGTCGFSSVTVTNLSQPALLILTMGMFIGGMSGSTTGGLKLKRLVWLWKAVGWRIKSLWLREGQTAGYFFDGEEVADNHAIRHVKLAAILAFLYGMTLLTGSFLLFLILGARYNFSDILFETASALGSVGLSVGITNPDMPSAAKGTLITLMWVGRLEIIAVIMLLTRPFVKLFERHLA